MKIPHIISINAFILSVSLLLLSSCLSIDTEISLNENGSGTARFFYSVSTLAADIADIDSENVVLPFPVMREDFDIAALKAGGIEILQHDISDDGTRYFIESEISFNSLESLSLFSGSQFQLSNSGNNSILTITVYEGTGENVVTEETMSIVNENFSNDSISFEITFPGDIVRVEGATFSDSVVSFNISVKDLIQSTDEVQFSVEYR